MLKPSVFFKGNKKKVSNIEKSEKKIAFIVHRYFLKLLDMELAINITT